jgi:acetyl-CoA carboxylase carboxyl transferase subunit alpha
MMFKHLGKALQDCLTDLQALKIKELLAQRHERLMAYGKFKELG